MIKIISYFAIAAALEIQLVRLRNSTNEHGGAYGSNFR